MDEHLQYPSTEEEYKEALTIITRRASENGVAVERFWPCRPEDETVVWDVQIIPLESDSQ